MSELKRIVREFGRQVEEAETRTANTLGEVVNAIKITDKERRERINDALKKIQEGANMIGAAGLDIMRALEASEEDTGTIMNQVDGMKALRLADHGRPGITGIEDGKDETNG